MTSTKTKNLKTTMCAEFSSIFQLCNEVLNSATQASLVKATLETLLRFFNWIPLGYIFETPIIDTLRTRFLEMPDFRNVTLKCLTEIGGLQTGGSQNAYDEKLVQMFTEVLTTISKIIPLSLDLKTTYASSNSKDQEFIQNLALFLTNFFSVHLNVSLLAIVGESLLTIISAHREPSEPRFPHSCPFLPHPDLADRRPRNLQDLPRILDQARLRII